ncbi:phosphatidylinositol 4,5-bisphosphate 3-kinase catalytic subunit beta isoform-like isoform X2 [Mercenaria mercenaria]|uniref:phosphatidylinositol 4,5-bisphosphate 3-kinase catalytic subunit beta isoform-like isoform X2 n=1 Tax=Mercenaria mercenaria TaxID=6596 RepID=UPI00234EFE6B|nr:phosphatidylinositol 4,5-bisphosphate 3-kinase catalytic subunit beta isoform-like isoform X2 [Mercenaria mercenaria]XP_045207447.2 phosphatidylinositol 4,5-bisphosphate 3-kinase catalytic subunit beta isoform-like isoform X2 [Mercenaria mercenaria]XP_045207448.2 phosphatidylinositol 4,5-bisphosphate 3-kinase catalytic subunit beta isoform-like isoform X2 [Mercenaria mercenaria]
MPPTSIVCIPDISDEVSKEGRVQIDFLLPNGMFIQLIVDFHKPLDLLKQTLWESARKFPLFGKLKGKDNYFFEYLNRNGEREEVMDESLRLSEIRPIGKFLRLQERHDDEGHQTIDRQISSLLGSKLTMEMHAMPRIEVDDFRKRMFDFALSKVPQQNDFQAVFENKHPLQLRSSDHLPDELMKKLNNGYLVVSVRIQEAKTKFLIQSHVKESPEMIIDNAVCKWHNRSVRNFYDYVLKVVGQEDYLYGKTALQQFKYVYSCIQRNMAPEFWLVNRKSILSVDPSSRQRPLPKLPQYHMLNKHQDALVWDIEDCFEFQVKGIQNVEITSDQVRDNIDKVKLFVGLYHGSDVLGDVKTTAEMPVIYGNCNIGATLTFDLQVKDVQTASRLCFTLHGRMRGAKSLNPIAWVNIPVFDFRSRLLVGEHKLAMWPVTAELQLEETGCYPLGSVSLNPHNTIMLTVYFSDYNRNPPIVFPSDEKINECAAENMEMPAAPGHPDWHPPRKMVEQLDDILNSRQWDCLHEQDKELVWIMRVEIREKNAHALPLVLKSVKWNNHIDVAKMQILLSSWRQKIPVDHALELLDFNFPDKNVRRYAVDCLQDLSDDEVSLYLLQLVQALKYENYLYCPLAEFLLERALRNQHIGQQLFWLLKSELHNPIVTVRFGLLLETYLKASPDHLNVLYKQFDALNKLNALSQLIKSESKSVSKDEKVMEQARVNMRIILAQKSYQEKLSFLNSPLTPLYRLKDLSTEQCKFMDSKKRPLYLVWSNEDEEGQEIHIIYKNGDDLRQDMLTLQMLQVMDSIWQAEGLDLRINAYGCVATGFEQGMIEVVRRSATLAKIQKLGNKGAFDKKTLYDWLKDKNRKDTELETAIEEFTLSCAGYTVATYVLGIGDRHNDNIMLKETGQLFHIDFGHFLGNFKSKFGFKRERVPFVLTPHFQYVITKGESEKENYKKFENYCVMAYLALRRRGHLMIRLFMMMLMSGIPQLTSVNDLDYLKETLALDLKDDAAIKQFKSKMNEALNSRSTQFNWMVHLMAH